MAGRLTISTLNDDTGVLATQNGMSGIAKAWVSFVGSTGVINASFNVSSITRGSTGNYTINMTTAMPTANYSAVAGAAIPSWQAWVFNIQSKTTSNFLVQYGQGTAPTFGDPADVNIAVFR